MGKSLPNMMRSVPHMRVSSTVRRCPRKYCELDSSRNTRSFMATSCRMS